jgi:hypothetical protein
LKSKLLYILSSYFFCINILFGQSHERFNYQAGFQSIVGVDSSRIYKQGTEKSDPLHYRTIELDIWYPSPEASSNPLKFGELFSLLEQRSAAYGNEDYGGLTEEIALFYLANMGIEASAEHLIGRPTAGYRGLKAVDKKIPLILYMAGFNGMGFENYKVLERLAQEGFLVVSVWSVGRYPGNMSNKMPDMMEQVLDAEWALDYLKRSREFSIDADNIGLLGTSWGSMSAAALVARGTGIKAFLSFDGSEVHYFGDESDVDDTGSPNDIHIQAIVDADLLRPEKQQLSYLYIESDKKLEDLIPTAEYNYYERLNTRKRYLRFRESRHEDFTSIPSMVTDTGSAVQIHRQLIEITSRFFKDELLSKNDLKAFLDTLMQQGDVTTEKLPYQAVQANSRGNLVKGKILDAKTKAPLPYVNVGFLHKGRGTVTDEKGEFTMQFTEQELSDTIRISMIGYASEEFILSDLLKVLAKKAITLDEKIEAMNELVVVAKGLKEKVIGNKTESKFTSTGFSYDQLGAEMGIKVKITKSPTFVDALNFHVSYNRLSAKSIFRLNFYTVDNGKPGKNILGKNIFVEVHPEQTGPISVDLIPFDIILYEDAFVTLEWVRNEGVNKMGEAIFFSLGIFNQGTVYKPTSHARFRKHSNLGVGLNLNVRQ